MLGLSTSVMLLVAALNFWACVASKDVPGGQLQHKQVVDHAQQYKIKLPKSIYTNQTAKIVADQDAVIHALNMEIEQLKSHKNTTHVLQAKLEAQQREAAQARIQALDTERESQKHVAAMGQTLEALQQKVGRVEANQGQHGAELEELHQKVGSGDAKLTARQRLKLSRLQNDKRRGLQGANACMYDVIQDGLVDVADLLQVLAQFHLESCNARADFNGDCIVNVADLLGLLAVFGGSAADSDCTMGHDDSDARPVAYSRRWLQVTSEGRTVTESSAGPPAACGANIAGAVYFDTDIAEFQGCTGTSWEPLGGSKGNFLCQGDWAGGSCDADLQAPVLTCEPGIVSIWAAGDRSTYVLTAADIPKPVISNTGPDFTKITIELAAITSDSDTTMWTQREDETFDWSGSQTANNLAITVDIAHASASAEPDSAEVTTVRFTAADAAGNTGSCEVQLHVADADECTDGSHTCDASALCENLYDEYGDPGELSDHVVTGTYNCTCPQGMKGDGYSTPCIAPPPPSWTCGKGSQSGSGSPNHYNPGTAAGNLGQCKAICEACRAGACPELENQPCVSIDWFDSGGCHISATCKSAAARGNYADGKVEGTTCPQGGGEAQCCGRNNYCELTLG